MKNGKTLEGAYILWRWGDEDLENPRKLRDQLQDIVDQGFSLVFCELRATRYDIFDRQVVRTVTQVSQWAKSRNIKFWFNADPRVASRLLIGKTGERIQYLIAHPKAKSESSQPLQLIKKIVNNQISLRHYYPRQKLTHSIPEVSLSFDPVALEKAFIFQMDGDCIIRESIKDVTSHVHFFVNIAKHYVEIYGQINIPEDETWWAISLPKYNINLIDYSSRENNDLLYRYIEDLFDEGAYIDGLFWQQPGYIVEPWQFPVSECNYNAFQVEYGYDLRKYLYALVLPVDDKSHLKIRHDYYAFLNDSINEAGKDFSKISKSFLGNVDFSISYEHQWKDCTNQPPNHNILDEWDSLNGLTDSIGHIGQIKKINSWISEFLPILIEIKSRSVYSNTQEAISTSWLEDQSEKNLEVMTDLLALYSIRWCAVCYGYSGYIHENNCQEPILPRHKSWTSLKKINQKIHDIYGYTGFILPHANIAIVYPAETLKTASPNDIYLIKQKLNTLYRYLTLNQLQVDIISPELLLEGKLNTDGFHIRHRKYQTILYPFPDIISEKLPDMVLAMINFKFPFYFIYAKPQTYLSGKKVSESCLNKIECIEKNDDLNIKCELNPLFTYPKNCLGTMIRVMDGELFLIMPLQPDTKITGKIQYQSIEFEIEATNRLSIYSHWGGGKVQKIY